MTIARIFVLLVLLSAASAFAETRYVVARDYAYGGGSSGDLPDWRAVTWVWRSAADREACRESLFAKGAQRSDPLGTPQCKRARLAGGRHRTAVDVLASSARCGALTTITFVPDGGDRLTRLTGCLAPTQLADSPQPLQRGSWVFIVDVHDLADVPVPALHRIGAYPTWVECEAIRKAVREDLAKEADTEAADGAILAAAGVCVPQEIFD